MEPSYPDDFTDLIEVVIFEGSAIEVLHKGVPVRAIVRDYDVTFPVDAALVKRDEEGDYYSEYII